MILQVTLQRLKVSDCSLMAGDAKIDIKESEMSKVQMTQEYIRKRDIGNAIIYILLVDNHSNRPFQITCDILIEPNSLNKVWYKSQILLQFLFKVPPKVSLSPQQTPISNFLFILESIMIQLET